VADGPEAPPPVLHGRHLGSGTAGVAGAGGRQGRDRLAGVGRLHERPGSPAGRDGSQVGERTDLAHRGHRRMTRIRAVAGTNRRSRGPGRVSIQKSRSAATCPVRSASVATIGSTPNRPSCAAFSLLSAVPSDATPMWLPVEGRPGLGAPPAAAARQQEVNAFACGAGDGNRSHTVSLGTDSLQGHSPRWLRARVMARVPFRTRMSVDMLERYSRIRLCCNTFRVWSG
jgi:hypothetical protein